MPLLDRDQLLWMRVQVDHCDECLNWVLKNYCRQCDEFFQYGHDKNCKVNRREDEKHQGHRTEFILAGCFAHQPAASGNSASLFPGPQRQQPWRTLSE